MSATTLESVLRPYPSVLIGFSGGVDSAFLAVSALRTLGRERVLAALGVSPSLSRRQHEQARQVADEYGLPLVEVPTDEFADRHYVANAPNRCFYCKRELWAQLTRLAEQRGLAVIADGTNADDGSGHRPGVHAAQEFDVRSPLAEAGYDKSRVRDEARRLGLPIWDAPAAPCLASRVRYGLEVTPTRLHQVEEGEEYLRGLGIDGDLRVRHRGDEARIEVEPRVFPIVRRHRTSIAMRFRALGFAAVTLDLGGYRSGSLLRPAGRTESLMESA